MDATYRRRPSGRGNRKKNAGLSAPERRRLLQLGASAALFLLVFVGRGVLPRQMDMWKEVLTSDMDLQGAAAALGKAVSEGDGAREALEAFWADLTGGAAEPAEASAPADPELPASVLPGFLTRMEDPTCGRLPALAPRTEGAGETAEGGESETPAASEEPAATAMAQQYGDAGEELPEKVSFQYYDLGLEETAVPVVGTVTSAFGFRDHPVSGAYSFHTAVDIGVERGTDVLAFAAGTVRYIGENSIFGLYVRLDHDNNVSTFYAHCQELLVDKGDAVSCGQVIARSGDTGNATGPHLHFSLDKDGIRLDPAWYLP